MPSSYTEKQVNQMVDIYTNNPCIETVERLMTLLNKPKRSIISKLVKEGVYITKGYRTKTGETPVTKLELVRSIEDALDVTLPGLDKAPKSTLKLLQETVLEQTTFLEETLENIRYMSESERLTKEMLSQRKSDVFTLLD